MISNVCQISCLNVIKKINKWKIRDLSIYPALTCLKYYSSSTNEEPPVVLHDMCYIGPIAHQPKIIIVGAGVAGLSAAQRLVQCGLNDILILEGNDRIGGRVFTCDFHGCNIELGAQWIYGNTIGNTMYNLATQECLLSNHLVKRDPDKGIFFTSDGCVIDMHIYQKAQALFKKIIRMLMQTKEIDRYKSVWHFVMTRIDEEMKKLTAYEQNLSRRVLLSLTNDLKNKYGADLSDIGLKKLGFYNNIPGGDVTITKGFKNVFNSMLKAIPKDSIKLRTTALTINWYTGSSPRVEITTTDGRIYRGDYVIVTVSLGVLKEKYKTLFHPELPKNKIEAIEKLGYGHLNKVFFHYERPFWYPNEAYIRPAWTDAEINDRLKWIHSISLIEEVPGCANLLQFSVGGTEAMYLERARDSEIVKTVTKLIHTFAGDSSLPFPTSIARSKWSYDPLYYGAFSFMANESLPKHMNVLAAPLPGICKNAAPSLYIAGEATSVGNQGTVHGARLSGIREADRIITLTKRFKGPPPIIHPSRTCTS